MNSRISICIAVVFVIVMAAALVFAHGGGLDGQGGHHNRKAGGYHFHRGPLAGQSFASKAAGSAALRARSSPKKPAVVASHSSEDEVAALVSLLVKKGIITRSELETEIRTRQ
jgi:hypothetical protein